MWDFSSVELFLPLEIKKERNLNNTNLRSENRRKGTSVITIIACKIKVLYKIENVRASNLYSNA